jgi:hypothetical protein
MKEESSGIAVALTFSFVTFSFAARQKKSITGQYDNKADINSIKIKENKDKEKSVMKKERDRR